jgi:hypothetical protein
VRDAHGDEGQREQQVWRDQAQLAAGRQQYREQQRVEHAAAEQQIAAAPEQPALGRAVRKRRRRCDTGH